MMTIKVSQEMMRVIKYLVTTDSISEDGIYPIHTLDLYLSKKRLMESFVDSHGEAAEIEVDEFIYWYFMTVKVSDVTYYLYCGRQSNQELSQSGR